MTRAYTGGANPARSPGDPSRAAALHSRPFAFGSTWPSARGVLVAGFTVCAIVLGGGGSPSPRPELMLQAIAALCCCIWVFLPRLEAGRWSRAVLVLAGLVVALPLLQLVPLPPTVWQALPGRELEVQALALAGTAQAWMPWTISPPLTLASLMAMLPPVAAMLMVSRLDLAGRRLAIATIAAMGAVSVAVGTLQLSANGSSLVAFYPGSFGKVFGFQANRNAEVDVLLIALVGGAAIYATLARRGIAMLAIAAAFMLVMTLGALLTASRAGIAMIPVAWLFGILLLNRQRVAPARLVAGFGVGLVFILGAGWLLRDNTALNRVAARFVAVEDFRAELWADTWYAITQYWPAGSGMGTIVPVLISVERLEVVDATLPNRAHNDYLELALEGGAIGLVLLGLAAGLLGWMMWRAWRTRSAATSPIFMFAGATIIVVALHSIVDYPLRSMALAHLAGVAAGLLVPLGRGGGAEAKTREFQA